MTLILPTFLFLLPFSCNTEQADTGLPLLAPPSEPTDDPEEELPDGEDTGLPTDTIEIVGSYENVEGGVLVIDETAWDFGTALFHVSQYDNDGDYAIAQNDANNQEHPSRWSKFQWLFDGGGSILYCQSVIDASLEEDALAADNAGTDNYAEGCLGDSWTAIRPKLDLTGTYVDENGIRHLINAWEWRQEGQGDPQLFYVAGLSNEEGWVVAENGVDNTNNPRLWSVFQWTKDSEDQLYFCQSSDTSEMKEDAIAQERADTEDLSTGCNGAAWTAITPD